MIHAKRSVLEVNLHIAMCAIAGGFKLFQVVDVVCRSAVPQLVRKFTTRNRRRRYTPGFEAMQKNVMHGKLDENKLAPAIRCKIRRYLGYCPADDLAQATCLFISPWSHGLKRSNQILQQI